MVYLDEVFFGGNVFFWENFKYIFSTFDLNYLNFPKETTSAPTNTQPKHTLTLCLDGEFFEVI